MGCFRERVVKRPRIEHKCDFCRKPITGIHIYISGKGYLGMAEDRQKR